MHARASSYYSLEICGLNSFGDVDEAGDDHSRVDSCFVAQVHGVVTMFKYHKRPTPTLVVFLSIFTVGRAASS